MPTKPFLAQGLAFRLKQHFTKPHTTPVAETILLAAGASFVVLVLTKRLDQRRRHNAIYPRRLERRRYNAIYPRERGQRRNRPVWDTYFACKLSPSFDALDLGMVDDLPTRPSRSADNTRLLNITNVETYDIEEYDGDDEGIRQWVLSSMAGSRAQDW
ncbi:hypothetical protein LTR17_020080 [Elasticomyces elasticus]|nr:hypothetical protein LTR17_020080 [Elasticomyces elasticus]